MLILRMKLLEGVQGKQQGSSSFYYAQIHIFFGFFPDIYGSTRVCISKQAIRKIEKHCTFVLTQNYFLQYSKH